jgi:hypothetical protein
MITLPFIQDISAKLTYITTNYDTSVDARDAFIDFFSPLAEDDKMAHIGNLLFVQDAILTKGGGDMSHLITEDNNVSLLLNNINNELMEQLDILFNIACIRQQLRIPNDIRHYLLILLNFTNKEWDFSTTSYDPVAAGHGFYNLVKNIVGLPKFSKNMDVDESEMPIYQILRTLSRNDRDQLIAANIKNLIHDMYSNDEVSMAKYMEDNANIQQVGLYYGLSDTGIEYIASNGLKVDADKHDGVFGVSANMAVRYMVGTAKDIKSLYSDTNDAQMASTFEHFFMHLLKDYIIRLNNGETLGELNDDLSKIYAPQKEFLLG